MTTKQDILNAIRQAANENGGRPLGQNSFTEKTGIKAYEWKKFWPRFGDAQKEAGFSPNILNKSLDDDFIIEKMIGLIRKLGKFPTHGDLRIEKNNDSKFPNSKTLFETKEQKWKLAQKISEWCVNKKDYQDIINFCASVLEKSKNNHEKDSETFRTIGEVYLFKSGRYYKIGKTNDTVRRGAELRIQLPERMDLIHSIKTDDPSGIEAYWHKRFESKRMNGEWFDLKPSDVKAFKCWKRII